MKWSKPKSEKAGADKGGFFSLFKKDKPLDQSKIKASREEVLKVIDEFEKGGAKPKSEVVRNNGGDALRNLFYKKPETKSLKKETKPENKEEKEELKKVEKPLSNPSLKPTNPTPPRADIVKIKENQTYKINFFNRLIDLWREYKERKERKRLLKEENKKKKAEIKKETGAKTEKAVEKNDVEKKEKEAEKENEPERKSKKLINSNVLETNLIKDEVVSYFNWKKNLIIIASYALAACVLVGIADTSLYFWGRGVKTQVDLYENKINEANNKIAQAKTDTEQFSSLEKKVKLIEDLLSGHYYWTNLFKFLEDNTLANVFFADFKGDISGNYNLEARAKSYDDVSKQIAVFRNNPEIKDVNIDEAKLDATATSSPLVIFNLKFSLNPEIFKK